MVILRNKIDFELGHLLRSPCVKCSDKSKSPKCADKCELLDRIRTRLAAGISSTYSAYEP